MFSCGVSAWDVFSCTHSCVCTSDSANLSLCFFFFQGSLLSWRTLGHEEIEASVQVSVSSSHICPCFPSVFLGVIFSSVLLQALQLTSGLSPGREALLLVGRLDRCDWEVMKSWVRQWRRLVLVGMLAWALLFLALLSYFLDARVNEPLTSTGSLLSQHPDTRRLASIQASQLHNTNLGSRPELVSTLTATYTRDDPEPSATPEFSLEASHSPNSAPVAIYSVLEGVHQDYLDPQSLAAWSSFGTENIDSRSGVQSRERTFRNHGSITRYHGGEEEEEEERQENEDEDMAIGMRNTVGRKPGGDSSEPENYYFSKSISVVQRLWRGHVSADMLSPRLQRAMKDYVSANKHHVSYRGRRRPGQTARELLCEMKAQARLQTVDGTQQPFSSLGWASLVPSLPLHQLHKHPHQGSFKTCAVVTSAGAILRSGLGREIGEWRDLFKCRARHHLAADVHRFSWDNSCSLSAAFITQLLHIVQHAAIVW